MDNGNDNGPLVPMTVAQRDRPRLADWKTITKRVAELARAIYTEKVKMATSKYIQVSLCLWYWSNSSTKMTGSEGKHLVIISIQLINSSSYWE